MARSHRGNCDDGDHLFCRVHIDNNHFEAFLIDALWKGLHAFKFNTWGVDAHTSLSLVFGELTATDACCTARATKFVYTHSDKGLLFPFI